MRRKTSPTNRSRIYRCWRWSSRTARRSPLRTEPGDRIPRDRAVAVTDNPLSTWRQSVPAHNCDGRSCSCDERTMTTTDTDTGSRDRARSSERYPGSRQDSSVVNVVHVHQVGPQLGEKRRRLSAAVAPRDRTVTGTAGADSRAGELRPPRQIPRSTRAQAPPARVSRRSRPKGPAESACARRAGPFASPCAAAGWRRTMRNRARSGAAARAATDARPSNPWTSRRHR